jgi:hypothetical protein
MAELNKGEPVTLQELTVSTLAMTDALAKLLIEKGVITDVSGLLPAAPRLRSQRQAQSAHLPRSPTCAIHRALVKHRRHEVRRRRYGRHATFTYSDPHPVETLGF